MPKVRSRRFPKQRARTLDIVLATVTVAVPLLLLTVQHPAPGIPWRHPDAWCIALVTVQGLALLARRHWPVPVLILVLAANCAYYAAGYPPTGFDFALGLAVYTVAAWKSTGVSAVCVLFVLGTITALWQAHAGPYWKAIDQYTLGYLVFFFTALWAWGRYQSVRRVYTSELERRAENAEALRLAEEQQVLTAERNRIASELHDLLAHHLSVMVVQAGAARRWITKDIDRSARAVQIIEESGRQALRTVPEVVRALHEDGSTAALAPQPRLQDLDELVTRIAESGLPVTVKVSGKPGPLPPGVEIAAFRVVQEGLTNALKHASSGTAEVTIQYGSASLTVTVRDSGGQEAPATSLASVPSGHGLRGLHERVTLFGGALRSGPTAGGGFEVRAEFPIGPVS